MQGNMAPHKEVTRIRGRPIGESMIMKFKVGDLVQSPSWPAQRGIVVGVADPATRTARIRRDGEDRIYAVYWFDAWGTVYTLPRLLEHCKKVEDNESKDI